MARYKLKPQFVDAERFDPYGSPIRPGTLPPSVTNHVDPLAATGIAWTCQTVIGPLPIAPGDWVVTYDDGGVVVLDDVSFQRAFNEVTAQPAELLHTGAVAISPFGHVGLITRTVVTGSGPLYLGIHLTGPKLGKSWSTRDPQYVCHINDLLRRIALAE